MKEAVNSSPATGYLGRGSHSRTGDLCRRRTNQY